MLNWEAAMDYKLKCDVIEWDVENWGKFIDFIEKRNIDFNNKKVLELGARDGGLSLYFALKGAYVTCTDLEGPTAKANVLHERYNVADRVTYEAVDGTDIPDKYYGQYDYVVFKSVIGGIGSFNDYDKQKACVDGIYQCLKPGGMLVFVENMQASFLHRFARKTFVKWGKSWHYENRKEIHELMKDFLLIEEKYAGVLGCFGRSEKGREKLGRVDTAVFDRILPDSCKYIGMYIYNKPDC